MTLFPFVELEFVHAIGPGTGRYVLAVSAEGADDGTEAEATEDVLQITVVHGATTTSGLRRRTKDQGGAAVPVGVPVLRVMWIGASQATGSQALAARRLEHLRQGEQEREELVDAVLELLNVAVRAHRSAARDPYITEVTRADPRAVRFGYGRARPLTQGQWSAAFLAPPPPELPAGRAVRLASSETVALALGGSLDLLESEELVLRALLDVEQRRWRAAALQLAMALRLLRAELSDAHQRGAAISIDEHELACREDRARALGELALRGELDPTAAAELRVEVAAAADVLDRWRVPPTVAR